MRHHGGVRTREVPEPRGTDDEDRDAHERQPKTVKTAPNAPSGFSEANAKNHPPAKNGAMKSVRKSLAMNLPSGVEGVGTGTKEV